MEIEFNKFNLLEHFISVSFKHLILLLNSPFILNIDLSFILSLSIYVIVIYKKGELLGLWN